MPKIDDMNYNKKYTKNVVFLLAIAIIIFLESINAVSVLSSSETIQYGYDNGRQITSVTYNDETENNNVYDTAGNRLIGDVK